MRSEIPYTEIRPVLEEILTITDEPGISLDRITGIFIFPRSLHIQLSGMGSPMRELVYSVTFPESPME